MPKADFKAIIKTKGATVLVIIRAAHEVGAWQYNNPRQSLDEKYQRALAFIDRCWERFRGRKGELE